MTKEATKLALRKALAEQQELVAKIIANLEPLLAAKNQSWAYAENALLELLAAAPQPAQQEPVIWAISYDGKTPYAIWFDGDGALLDLEIKRQGGTASKMPLYTSPQPAQPSKPWVGLTDAEITDIWAESSPYYHEDDFARAIEAKLKEKNT